MNDTSTEPSLPLLAMDGTTNTYHELASLLRRIQTNLLTPELTRRVLSFLVIYKVQPNQVVAVDCSSHDKRHALSAALEDSEDSWWISAQGSMPLGMGHEFVEFQLGPCARRLTSVSIKIPPLPAGPLSVLEFKVQVAFDEDDSWKDVGQFVVANRTGWQDFVLQTSDTKRARIVCLRNQMSPFLEGSEEVARFLLEQYFCVGFYAARFG